MFEIPAGGRRFRALELLVKQKRLAKTAPVSCVVREGGIAEEDSLAENIQRVALHPLDQFRAFQALRDKGLGDEEIAARFFVTPTVVKQRLRLAAASNKLLDIYAEDGGYRGAAGPGTRAELPAEWLRAPGYGRDSMAVGLGLFRRRCLRASAIRRPSD